MSSEREAAQAIVS